MSLITNSLVGSNFIQEQIFSRLNLDYLPEEEKRKLLDSITEIITQRVLLRILSGLPKEKSEVLAELLEKDENDDEVTAFIEENVSEFLTILQEEIEAVSSELVNVLKK